MDDNAVTPRPGTVLRAVEPGKDTSEYKLASRVALASIVTAVAGVAAEAITGGAIALPGGLLWGPLLGAAAASGLYSLARAIRKRGR